MITTVKTEMGRVAVQIELVNHADAILAKFGALSPEKVRRVALDAIVDTGASHLVVPKAAAEALGLPVLGETGVRFADHRKEPRKIVGDVEVHLLSRDGVFRAIVEPNRPDVLLGAIVLEDMDFVVDCREQKLVPRDPHMILSEIE